jgi:hypothetical protein
MKFSAACFCFFTLCLFAENASAQDSCPDEPHPGILVSQVFLEREKVCQVTQGTYIKRGLNYRVDIR